MQTWICLLCNYCHKVVLDFLPSINNFNAIQAVISIYLGDIWYNDGPTVRLLHGCDKLCMFHIEQVWFVTKVHTV